MNELHELVDQAKAALSEIELDHMNSTREPDFDRLWDIFQRLTEMTQ